MEHKRFKSLFKIYFIGLITMSLIFSILAAILYPFGYTTVTLNGNEVTGILAIILPFVFGLIMSFILAVILGIFGWIGYKILNV